MTTMYTFSSDDVYDILRKEILTLALEPGTLLSENMVSARFGTSRTPTRSVFEHLRTDGLIDVIPKKGSFVSLIDPELSEQIIYLRISSELGVMTQLTRKPSRDLMSLLKKNLEEQERLLDQELIRDEFFSLDSRFHELCMQATGKGRLWQMIQHMDVHYSRYRYMDYELSNQKDIYPSLYHQHLDLYQALKEQNPFVLKYLLTSHLYSGFLRIGTKLQMEYGHYFVKGTRSIGEILVNVKILIQDSWDELQEYKKKGFC